MNLTASNTAVLVIDMQNCFARPDGILYSEPSENVIPEIKSFVEMAQDSGALIGFTRDTHSEDQFEELDNYDEFDRWGEHAVPGTEGHQLVEELQEITPDIEYVDKNTYDAFYETNLNQTLEEHDIENVIVIGTLANVCVMHTASSAALNDFNTIVLEDLVGYITEEHKEYALEHVDWLFGNVVESGSISFE